jgi:hypothetical protein
MKKRLSNILCVWLPLFFLAAYIGSYFALVKAMSSGSGIGLLIYSPVYIVPNSMLDAAEYLYRPMYYFDRRIIRPNFWKDKQAPLH